MNDESKTSAAYHEAGHVIIARSRGITPKYVEIHYNPTCQRWEGTTELPDLTGPTKEKVESLFAICFAGCFAQVKHAIRILSPTAPIPWKELFEWTIMRSHQPLELSLSIGKKLEVPSWWFDGADKQQFEYLGCETIAALGEQNFMALLQRAMRHTVIPELEEVQSWNKIEVLAGLLISSAENGISRISPAQFPL